MSKRRIKLMADYHCWALWEAPASWATSMSGLGNLAERAPASWSTSGWGSLEARAHAAATVALPKLDIAELAGDQGLAQREGETLQLVPESAPHIIKFSPRRCFTPPPAGPALRANPPGQPSTELRQDCLPAWIQVSEGELVDLLGPWLLVGISFQHAEKPAINVEKKACTMS
jgi:hypothetical protein